MGKLSRVKGASTEREIVNLHRKIGIHAERVPLSGGMRYQGNGEDVDVHAFGEAAAPLVAQVKRLSGPRGTKGILDALGDADILFLRYDAESGQQVMPPTIVMPWRTYERLLKRR